MNDAFYNLGGALFWGLILGIVLFCINKIRKNYAEIKRLENQQKKDKK